MYKLIKLISIIIRTAYLPNTFISLIGNEGLAFIVNAIIGETIIGLLSYSITSIYYCKGEAPVVGSASYLFWYIINTFIFMGVGYLTSSTLIFIIILAIVYVIVFNVIGFISGKNGRYNY